jgi:tetratricopeptide (TPR) repeat protein
MTLRCFRVLLAFSFAATASLAAAPVRADEEKALTPNAHFMSGKLYLSQKVYDKAEREFKAAVDGDSTKADYHGHWATALSYLAKERIAASSQITDRAAKLEAVRAVGPLYETARAEFEKAMVLDPKKADDQETNRLHFWVELYQLADASFKRGDFEDALELYKLTTVLDPKEPTGVFYVGYTLSKLDPPQTIEAVKMTVKARDMAAEKIAELGDCSQFKSNKKKNDCQKKIKNLETIQTNVENFTKSKNVELGRYYMDLSKTEQDVAKKRENLSTAIGYFDKGLEQDPALTGVIFEKADALFKTGQTYDGDAANSSKYYGDAATVFLSIADNDSLDAETRNNARYNAIMAMYAGANWQGVVPQMKMYIDADPKDQDIWMRLAKASSELKENKEAAQYLMTANALGAKADAGVVVESVNTVKNLYGTSDAARAHGELGDPEEVRVYEESSEGGHRVITWIWWKKGQIRHFVDGVQVGQVSFAPLTGPAPSTSN